MFSVTHQRTTTHIPCIYNIQWLICVLIHQASTVVRRKSRQPTVAEKIYIWWNGTDHWKSDWIKERSAGVIKFISACIYDLLLPYVTVEQLRAHELQLKKIHQFCQRFKYLKTLQYSQTHYILDVMHISQILKDSVSNQPSPAPHTHVPPVPEFSIQTLFTFHPGKWYVQCTEKK